MPGSCRVASRFRGEVELAADDVRGIAVNLASRVLALAGDGDVLVSGTTHELLGASSLQFDDGGEHELKGIPGRVYALVRASGDAWRRRSP